MLCRNQHQKYYLGGLKHNCSKIETTYKYFIQDINIGNGDEKVMDAIWVCEQSARELGYKEDTIPWKIYYRKEVYCPSDEFHMDISWTDFAYKFVVNNIKTRVSTKLKKVSKISNINVY